METISRELQSWPAIGHEPAYPGQMLKLGGKEMAAGGTHRPLFPSSINCSDHAPLKPAASVAGSNSSGPMD
jgi:hypothetical protein